MVLVVVLVILDSVVCEWRCDALGSAFRFLFER